MSPNVGLVTPHSRCVLFLYLLCSSIAGETIGSEQEVVDMLSWARSGGARFPKLVVRNSKDKGRGVYATENIKLGEEILYVPDRLVIAPINSLLFLQKHIEDTCSFPAGDDSWREGISDLHLMALFLLQQRNDSLSEYHPYTMSFPDRMDTTIHWTDEELQELQDFTLRKKRSLQGFYSDVMERLQGRVPASVIWSRSFVVTDNRGEKGGALVPISDMFNYRGEEDVTGEEGTGEGGMIVRAKKDIREGEEIYLRYGRRKMTNGQLMMDYGFLLEVPEDDGVMIPSIAPTERNTPLSDQRADILSALQLDGDFVYVSSSSHRDILTCTRVHRMSELDFEGRMDPRRPFEEERRERSAVRACLSHLKRILQRYPKEMGEVESYRRSMARQLAREEKERLNEIVENMEKTLQKK
ncbi:hypothetical protein PROFUN_09957 [Planoprotostelium fungivorum]|uniref:SET domain-containing protein n=1 Tax=Planoprotostelium fungivorum TaxID=1890364 RepID=A0A2P6NGB6_9EUKA|nr:hypothetical protein PROFUN_16076 [Planoprotostelium fungivorum]PRP83006.1 hypothetical protein PROFUN_09957 [Planoprotostelium fungivorum]